MEMEDSALLYEAAARGCMTTLNTLIQKDKLILHRVSLTSFTDTPLHVSALLGHLCFTITILELNPGLASELDFRQRSPLHLASAEGHTEIVKALLRVRDGACLARDQDGRIPLHLAAMRGRIQVIQELVTACPASVSELLDGDTVLHLCVKYNHLGALKLLVLIMEEEDEIVKENQEGNTILHLSVRLKQSKTIRYLLSLPGIKSRANALNGMGLTALDVLQLGSRDYRTLEIQNLLIEAGARRSKELTSSNFTLMPNSGAKSASSSAAIFPSKSSRKSKSWFSKCMRLLEYDREETRGALMIVATVIATITFQAALNPPGGVWQQNYTNNLGGPACSDTNVCEAGTSVLAYANPEAHITFLTYNSVAFVASLSVIALIVGGFPLRNKFCVWLLAQAIFVTVTFLAFGYLVAIVTVTPSSLRNRLRNLYFKLYWIWIGVLLLASLIEAIRFIAWTVKKLRRCWRKILKAYTRTKGLCLLQRE
eukprot:XP_015576097.1 ankyrin repeat-containing protein BDA1 [Ricinus communis]